MAGVRWGLEIERGRLMGAAGEHVAHDWIDVPGLRCVLGLVCVWAPGAPVGHAEAGSERDANTRCRWLLAGT